MSAGPLGSIVVDVGLEHGLLFLRGCRRSLSDDGLFGQLVAKCIQSGNEYSFDGGHVDVDAEVA